MQIKKMRNLILIPIIIFLASCSKEEINKREPIKSDITIDVRDYEKWIYFSFEKGIIATPESPEKNLSWDLAFHRWDIKTNGGEAGNGAGGAIMSQLVNLDQVTATPKEPFITDSKILTYMKTPDMSQGPGQRVEVPANTEIGKWMKVIMSTIPPGYQMSDKVFFVRRANGEIAAIKFSSYMNDKAEKGFVSFDYIYPIQ